MLKCCLSPVGPNWPSQPLLRHYEVSSRHSTFIAHRSRVYVWVSHLALEGERTIPGLALPKRIYPLRGTCQDAPAASKGRPAGFSSDAPGWFVHVALHRPLPGSWFPLALLLLMRLLALLHRQCQFRCQSELAPITLFRRVLELCIWFHQVT